MHIEHIKLTQFRNYALERLDFDAKFNVLVGNNGMGKTNVLDAIHYSCIGKSYFTAMDKFVTMQGQTFFRIETVIDDGIGKEVVVIKSPLTGKKEIELSGKKMAKLSDHVGRFLCVLIAPSDIHAMMDTSDERRNYINNTISQTSRTYLDDLILYHQILKRRNMLLKSFSEQKYNDALLLQSISTGMIEPAHRIYEARQKIMVELNQIFQDLYTQLSGSSESCEIVYESKLATHSLDVLFASNVEKDRILGRTTQGIHKDDLVFYMNGEPLKNYASQGQLKSFVLALKLAQYHILHQITRKKPVLLLDDIFDKLDQSRVKHLLHILDQEPFGQVFVTDTGESRMREVLADLTANYRIFTIENGKSSHIHG